MFLGDVLAYSSFSNVFFHCCDFGSQRSCNSKTPGEIRVENKKKDEFLSSLNLHIAKQLQ